MEFYCPSQKEVEQKYILILTDHVFGSAAVIISHRFIVFTVFFAANIILNLAFSPILA